METEFEKQQALFWQQVGEHGCMVLSTSLHDEVTSRMMSFLLLEGELWFQTDRRFQKYRQLRENPRVSLCRDNMTIHGLCREVGRPSDNPAFCEKYRQFLSRSYRLYTGLEEERLFAITPVKAKKWMYDEDGQPYVETLDFRQGVYEKEAYSCQKSSCPSF